MNFFAAGTIADDDGAEQSPDNSESKAEDPHRVPVKLVKIEGRAKCEAMSRPGEESDPLERLVISPFGALSIAISVHTHNPIRSLWHEDY